MFLYVFFISSVLSASAGPFHLGCKIKEINSHIEIYHVFFSFFSQIWCNFAI